MSNIFKALLDLIMVATSNSVSVTDYFSVVQCIRDVAGTRTEDLSESERNILSSRNLNPAYNPFVQPYERIRFGMNFGMDDNLQVAECIALIKAYNMKAIMDNNGTSNKSIDNTC
jgi:hypothetical protein